MCAHQYGSRLGVRGSKPETAGAPFHPRTIPQEEEVGRRYNSPAAGVRVLQAGEGDPGGAPTVAVWSCVFATQRLLRTSLFLATI